eukprot:5036441-Prymnesium_polylepis.1
MQVQARPRVWAASRPCVGPLLHPWLGPQCDQGGTIRSTGPPEETRTTPEPLGNGAEMTPKFL